MPPKWILSLRSLVPQTLEYSLGAWYAVQFFKITERFWPDVVKEVQERESNCLWRVLNDYLSLLFHFFVFVLCMCNITMITHAQACITCTHYEYKSKAIKASSDIVLQKSTKYNIVFLFWLQLNEIICPFKSDSSQSFFCAFSIDQSSVWNFIASLLIAFLHFISFRDNVWLSKQRGCFMDGPIRWESKSICQLMLERLITGSSIKTQNGLRWLTSQLKALCRDLGWRPSVGCLVPSRGLLKSSIMKNFILLLNVGYVLFWKPQKWSEFGQIGPWTERAQSLLSSTVIFFHWFGRKRVTGHIWNGGVFLKTVPTLGKIKYSGLFLLPKTPIKAHSIPT